MRSCKLIEDAQMRPDLFRWNGRMDSVSLRAWLDRNPWALGCPKDLLALWQTTGGGDAFETETILGPLGDPELGDDIASINRDLRSQGMSETFVVFHVGLLMSGVDTALGDYVELVPSGFRVARRFLSLDDWYIRTLRAEYAQRYALP